jgi:hypothetical protein
MRNAYKILFREPVDEETTWTHRRRWDDNIKMDLKEIWWEDVDWTTDLARNRDRWQAIVNTVINLRSPQSVGNLWTS